MACRTTWICCRTFRVVWWLSSLIASSPVSAFSCTGSRCLPKALLYFSIYSCSQHHLLQLQHRVWKKNCRVKIRDNIQLETAAYSKGRQSGPSVPRICSSNFFCRCFSIAINLNTMILQLAWLQYRHCFIIALNEPTIIIVIIIIVTVVIQAAPQSPAFIFVAPT